MVRPISDWDFYGGTPKPDSRFYIIATVTGFPTNDPACDPNWFLGENSARPVWWDEKNATLSVEMDPPEGTSLAAQMAIAGRFDDEACEFETLKYFYYGESDPFTDGCIKVPTQVIRSLGIFLLSSNREWDKLLSFGSSSFLKVIREYDALPGKSIEELKKQLRSDMIKIEEAIPLSGILREATKELQSFLLIGESNKLVYRPTSLDSFSVLQSLVAHVTKSKDSLIPVSRHGAGMISLQAFLLLLAFARYRRDAGQNFILVAEEPELHLHPSLHQRLVNRIKAVSEQSIVTTQSPNVASGYQPNETVFVQNDEGDLKAIFLRAEPVRDISTNSIKKLYLVHRRLFYEALMGGSVLVPEGISDFEWLSLWQQIAQSSPDMSADYDLKPITIVPTSDAAIIETFKEIQKFRPDSIPIVDGDNAGVAYLDSLISAAFSPKKIIRYGKDAATECLSAWILEPCLSTPGEALMELLPNQDAKTLKGLQGALIERKKDRDIRERLAWEALNSSQSCKRACEFFHDITAIAFDGTTKNLGWNIESKQNGISIYNATHIKKV